VLAIVEGGDVEIARYIPYRSVCLFFLMIISEEAKAKQRATTRREATKEQIQRRAGEATIEEQRQDRDAVEVARAQGKM